MKNNCIALALLCATTVAPAQNQPETLTIPLSKELGGPLSGTYYLLTQVPSERFAPEMIPEGIEHYDLQVIDLNQLQSFYERSLEKKMTKKDSLEMQFLDFSKMSKRPTAHRIYALSTFREGKKLIIVDTDNNGDFRNDKVFYFDIPKNGTKRPDALPTAPVIFLNYEFFDGKTYLTKTFAMKVMAFPDNIKLNETVAPEDNLGVILVGYESRKGTFKTQAGNIFHVAVRPYLRADDYRQAELVIKAAGQPYKENYRRDELFREGDVLTIEGQQYQMEPMSHAGESVVLKHIPKGATVTGHLEGMLCPDITGTQLDGSSKKLSDYSGSYVLLDFWGTWCAPCIAEIPEMKALRDKMQKRPLKIVSVALVIDGDLEKLRHFIKKEDMNWAHFWETGSGDKGFIQRLRISAFPTYILLSPEGKILLRGESGADSLKQVEEKLEELW